MLLEHTRRKLKGIEQDHHYMLLVKWRTVADHEVGFRQSPQYQEWRKLLHHFYDPFPTVLHYQTVSGTHVEAAS